jgi:transposase
MTVAEASEESCGRDRWHGRETVPQLGQRVVVLHFLAKYALELNPIERVWWVLYE